MTQESDMPCAIACLLLKQEGVLEEPCAREDKGSQGLDGQRLLILALLLPGEKHGRKFMFPLHPGSYKDSS